MNNGTWLGAGVLGVVLLAWGGWGLWAPTSAKDPKAAAFNSEHSSLARESKSLLGASVPNVYIGMLQTELQLARPKAKRLPSADGATLIMFNEQLPSGERALYAIDRKWLALIKVQVATHLKSVEEVAPRIGLMQSRYGAPHGVWDCPAQPGQLPTRRFTYLRNELGVMDSFLLVGEQTAATLQVSRVALIRDAMAFGKCVPAAKETFSKFPAVPLPSTAQAP